MGPIEQACSLVVSGARKFLRGTRNVYRESLSSDVSRFACVSVKQHRERERERERENILQPAMLHPLTDICKSSLYRELYGFIVFFADSVGWLVSNFYQPIQPGVDLIRYVLLRVSECPGRMNFVEAASHRFSPRLRCFGVRSVCFFLFFFSLFFSLPFVSNASQTNSIHEEYSSDSDDPPLQVFGSWCCLTRRGLILKRIL